MPALINSTWMNVLLEILRRDASTDFYEPLALGISYTILSILLLQTRAACLQLLRREIIEHDDICTGLNGLYRLLLACTFHIYP